LTDPDPLPEDRPFVTNRIYRSRPLAVHAPGTERESPWWAPIRTRLFNRAARYHLPDGVAIVTFNSGGANSILERRGHTLGWFERSLDHLGLAYTVLGTGIGTRWANRMKLDLALGFLAGTRAEIVLGGDSSDVLLIGDPGTLVERFRRQGAAVLFNAETRAWPREAREVTSFEHRVAKRPFRYLNSGLWIGRRAALIEAFTAARRWADRLSVKPDSDQICWKYAYRDLHPVVQIDDRCALFQCLNDVGRGLELADRRWPRLAWLTGRRPQ
jgi:hypothetical protein